MNHTIETMRHAERHLMRALALVDSRAFLVDAAFVQAALDRVRETIFTLSVGKAPVLGAGNDNGARTDAESV